MQKPPYKHVEVYNDCSGDLVNFWMQCRDQAHELEQRCRSLPYARSLYYTYHASLFDGTKLDSLERAGRWFYVLRSNFSSEPPAPVANGWSAGMKSPGRGAAHAYHSALDLFPVVQQRLRQVLIDCRDFAEVFHTYNRPHVLFYVDSPYLGCEAYYQTGVNRFSLEDHQRLADCLNNTKASVALSYYPHPLLDELYPQAQWRRLTWSTPKHSQRSRSTRATATEMLLTNYEPAYGELWQEVSA